MRTRLISGAVAASLLAASSPALADEVRVFVLSGQSNMTGYGDGPSLPSDLASQPGVLYDYFNPASRDGGDYAGTTSTDWEPVAPKGSGSWYGPEITFAKTIEGQLGSAKPAIVKLAASGSNIGEHWARGLAADQDYPWKSQLYHALLGSLDSATYDAPSGNELAFPDEPTRLDAALARLEADGHTPSVACVAWVQGENEAFGNAAFTYEQKLGAFIAAMREDLGRPDLPFAIARTALQTGQAGGGDAPDASLAAVRAAQESLAAADEKIELVDMDDLPGKGDNLHFSSAGYRTLGERLATACLSMQDGSGGGGGGAGGEGGAAGEGGSTGEGAGQPSTSTGTGAADDPGGAGAGGAGAGGDDGESGGCGVSATAPAGELGFVALLGLVGASLRRLRARRRRDD